MKAGPNNFRTHGFKPFSDSSKMLRLRTWLAAQDVFQAPLFLQASHLSPPDTQMSTTILTVSWTIVVLGLSVLE